MTFLQGGIERRWCVSSKQRARRPIAGPGCDRRASPCPYPSKITTNKRGQRGEPPESNSPDLRIGCDSPRRRVNLTFVRAVSAESIVNLPPRPHEEAFMSIAPLSARTFLPFLAVVASALFIVLTLGTVGHPANASYAEGSPGSSSFTHPDRVPTPRPFPRVRTAAMSASCYEQYVRQCRQHNWQDCVVNHQKVSCEYYCQWMAHHSCNR
jgi:hypothetical protein